MLSEGRDSAQGAGLAAMTACLVLGSWAVGQLWRARAQEVVAIRELMHQAEVGRAQAEQIAVLTERNRIAREMHDIIAHSVSGMVALADGGRYAAAADPEAAMDAFGEIARGGRQTLGELRCVISTVRDPSDPSDPSQHSEPSDPSDPSHQFGGPPPGVAEVAELVASTAARGLHVKLRSQGTPRAVPASTGPAAYRLGRASPTW